MILQNWWYTTLLNTNVGFLPPLREDLTSDILVVGGGMAGLHAALHLVRAGKTVVLLERNICGGSSTGKSAGFLTPDSELELNQLLRRYGEEGARRAWNIPAQGVELIVKTIKEYGLKCDFVEQDSLFLGIGASGRKAVEEEVRARAELGFPSIQYDEKHLPSVIGGGGYTAGVRYSGTYGINALLYAQELKGVLLNLGVKIFESTEVMHIKGHTANSHLGSVTAEDIIVCIDKMKPEFNAVAKQTYWAQTFMAVSEPLEDKDLTALFPEQELMCWDSLLVYSYYRLTGDRRLLLGGGSAVTTFSPRDVTTPVVINRVIRDFKKRFPAFRHIEFIQYWPGRIDTTRDLMPIVDFDPEQDHIQYILGSVGLPWAAFCGDYAGRRLLDHSYCHIYCGFLKIDRSYFIPFWVQKLLGKMITFSFNNAYSKYFQRDNTENFSSPHEE